MSNLPAAFTGNLPAYLKKPNVSALTALNDEAKVGSDFVSPPRISIRGKVFRLVIDGEERGLFTKNEEGEKVPISGLNVVVVGTNKGKYKTYYGDRTYSEDSSSAPICYSYDGIAPSPNSEEEQSKSCAACPHNVWGSKITDQKKQTRACSDNKLLAVLLHSGVSNNAPAESPTGFVFQMKIPPSALGRSKEDKKANPTANTSWAEYLDLLNHFPADGDMTQIPISTVLTRITFSQEASTPKPQFKPLRFLTEEEMAYTESRLGGDDIAAVVSENAAPVNKHQANLGAVPAPKLLAPEVTDEIEFEETPKPQPALVPVANPVPVEQPARRGRPPKQADSTVAASSPAPAPKSADVISDDMLDDIEKMFQ
jgi:hypothetical protein